MYANALVLLTSLAALASAARAKKGNTRVAAAGQCESGYTNCISASLPHALCGCDLVDCVGEKGTFDPFCSVATSDYKTTRTGTDNVVTVITNIPVTVTWSPPAETTPANVPRAVQGRATVRETNWVLPAQPTQTA